MCIAFDIKLCTSSHAVVIYLNAGACPYEQVPGQVGYFRSIDSPTEIQHCVEGMVFMDPPCECVQVGESKFPYFIYTMKYPISSDVTNEIHN